MMEKSAPIGIVAGGGGVVTELVTFLSDRNISYKIAAIRGEASENLTGEHVRQFSWGEIGRIINYFKTSDCQKLLLIGSVKSRPDFKSILGDPGTLRRIPRIVAALSSGGDDSVLRRIIDLIESDGFSVIGVSDVARDLLMDRGFLSKKRLSDDERVDLEKAKAALLDLGRHDIGQGLVIINRRIVAVEGAEGTDAMLARIGLLRQEGRISARIRGGLFVKAAKPDQDMRVDLPTIGPETVERAHKAGLSGLVVEANKVILLERGKVRSLADQYGMVLLGDTGFER